MFLTILMIYSTVNHQKLPFSDPTHPPLWWRNTWMVPLQNLHSTLTNNSFFCVSCPILNFQWVMSGSQSWNFIHWDQTNPSKVYLFLDADKFVLSFLLISNKSQLCWISRLNSSQMGLRGRHSNCLSNLLKIQNWAGNTEKWIYWSKVKWRFHQI